MSRTMFFFPAALLVVLAMVLSFAVMPTSSGITVDIPNAGVGFKIPARNSIEWDLTAELTSPYHLEVGEVAGWTLIEVPGLPEFPEICRELGREFEEVCMWEVRVSEDSDGNPIFDLASKVGDVPMSNAQFGLGRLGSLDAGVSSEVASSIPENTLVWNGSIKVAEWLRLFGLGRVTLEAAGHVIKFLSRNMGNERPLSLAADAAGWLPKVLGHVENLAPAAANRGYYLYYLEP